jgi:integrase/recombinase XerD
MAGRQAKTLSSTMLKRALALARRSAQADRDTVMILLSVRAGLRACEIAGLEWSMVLDSRGQVGAVLEIRDGIAKYGSGRRVPIHPELRAALSRLKRASGAQGPIIASRRGGALNPNSIVNWFITLFRAAGAEGCSSHSGRRTFVTRAAREAAAAGATLRDVQLLAGHRSIETTQRYIDGDTDAQRRLVRSL